MTPITYIVLILVSIWMSVCLSKPTAEVADADTLHTIANIDSNYRTQYANKMLSYMNLSVQPCDDFYEYACGNWKNTIEERQCENRRNNFLDIGYKMDDVIEQLLQRSDVNDVAPEYAEEFELVKKFYHNCLDTDLHPMRISTEYLKILQKFGGFPAVNPHWNSSEFSWLNMSAHLSNYGVDSLIKEIHQSTYPFEPLFPLPDFGFDIELHYDSINNISSKEYQLNNKRMHDMLTLYEVAKDQIDHVVEDIFEFLKATLNLMVEFKENQEICEEKSEALDESYADALRKQWTPYFDIAWKGHSVKLDLAHGPCIYFYHQFNKIAEKHKESIANYLSLKFLYHMDAKLQGPMFQKDYCIASLKKSLDFFFDHLYMKIYFNDEKSDDVRKMATEIHRSFRTVLQEVEWLDAPTREAALVKESVAGLYIGRYEDSKISKSVLGEMKNLKFVDGNYDANRLNLARYRNYITRYLGLHAEEISNSTKPLQLMLGMEINAFFFLADNNMYISASVLQPPAYHQEWPNSLKYGTLGFVLGHEITHGFDTTGSKFDHTGVYNNWWSVESKQRFDERAECFADFYSNYTVPEINRNINGDATKDENIADAGALHLAMMAYRRYVDEESKKLNSRAALNKQEQMPGVDATPEQLFFLGAAQMWCASFKYADYLRELSDSHTIDKYRVLGMVSNSADFAKAYNCPVGSNMNPTANKCKIW